MDTGYWSEYLSTLWYFEENYSITWKLKKKKRKHNEINLCPTSTLNFKGAFINCDSLKNWKLLILRNILIDYIQIISKWKGYHEKIFGHHK